MGDTVPLPPTHYVIGIEGDGYSADRCTMMPAWDDDAMHTHAAAQSAADNAALQESIAESESLCVAKQSEIDAIRKIYHSQTERVKVLEHALRECRESVSVWDVHSIARAALGEP